MSIGDKVKCCRKELRYTQRELAELIGCSSRYIAYIEAGQMIPGLKFISKLATVFCVPKMYLCIDDNNDRGNKYYSECDRRELLVGRIR